jgi:hypothetical protein
MTTPLLDLQIESMADARARMAAFQVFEDSLSCRPNIAESGYSSMPRMRMLICRKSSRI